MTGHEMSRLLRMTITDDVAAALSCPTCGKMLERTPDLVPVKTGTDISPGAPGGWVCPAWCGGVAGDGEISNRMPDLYALGWRLALLQKIWAAQKRMNRKAAAK